MSEEKRMAGDYEIIQSVHIGDREIVVGENPADADGLPYEALKDTMEAHEKEVLKAHD